MPERPPLWLGHVVRGLAPSTITANEQHRSFSVRDPDGRVVTVNDSHVVGPV